MRTQTKEAQDNLTPQDALHILVEGNKRFTQNLKASRDPKNQVLETSKGQFPFAVIHSCIDSRVPVELVFDQGIGDVLGSLEYGCKVAGSKIIIVLGHTKCGAVNAACNNVKLGNITQLLDKISPSIELIQSSPDNMSDALIEKVAMLNIEHSISEIRKRSSILNEMEKSGEIQIAGALYNVTSGEIQFFIH